MLRVLILLLIAYPQVYAQPSDFIALRKKDKTIRSYFAGSQIEFVTHTGAYRNAVITRINNDSIFLQEYLVRRMVTQFGFYVLDTAGSFHFAYHYKDIKSFGKQQKGFNVSGSGAALLGGGILLSLASGVVYLADRDIFSPPLLIGSASLAVVGYFLSKAGSKRIVPGKKKYHLDYINLSGERK